MQNDIIRERNRTRAQAALSVVFMIGGIALFVGVTLSFLLISFLNSSFGFQAANRALAVASTGAQDVMIRLLRDKGFPLFSPYVYSIPIDGISASVTVNRDTPVTGQVTVVSNATVSGRKRSIQAVVSVASTTGQVSLISWQQIVQ